MGRRKVLCHKQLLSVYNTSRKIGQSKTELVDENGKRIKNAQPLSIDEKEMLEAVKKTVYKVGSFKKRCRSLRYNEKALPLAGRVLSDESFSGVSPEKGFPRFM